MHIMANLFNLYVLNLDLVNYVSPGFNEDKTSYIAAFADLSKAFDSVDRGSLLKKMFLYGIVTVLRIRPSISWTTYVTENNNLI